MRILIVGGGNIAHEKLVHLLDFTHDIDIITQECSESMREVVEQHAIVCELRPYKEGDIDGYGIVIVAVDDIGLQEQIYRESKRYDCLCNAVDSIDYCDFIFPSYIKKGDLTIAVSTSGASPAMAKHLRIFLEKLIPESITEFLIQMRLLRKRFPKGKERMKMLDAKAKEYIESWSKR